MKKEVEKVAKTSADPLPEKLSELRKVIPEAFDENKIDWEKLKATLGGDIDTGVEKYGLHWAGKSDAFKAIRIPATGTLIPQEKESKNWDKTENLFIEGDNLEVLKLLQKHYRGQIKMCYIDPPYNTGKDFIYKDNFTENTSDYYERTGQSKDGIKLASNMESNGRYHSDWLTMMYPRLFLAKNLLKDDGVIFVSIDDNEVANLRMIMNEIFGEENFVADLIWQKSYSPKMDSEYFSNSHDHIFVYRKSENFKLVDTLISQDFSQFNLFDEKKKQNYRRRSWRKEGKGSLRIDAPSLFFSIKAPDMTNVFPIKPDGTESRWRGSIDTYNDYKNQDLVEWVKVSEHWEIYIKQYFQGNVSAPPESILSWEDAGHNHEGDEELKKLVGIKVFDNPKPTRLIKLLSKWGSQKDSLILDFFAGSGTTAHAVMDMNAEDSGNRKWVCVQIPEETKEDGEAYKASYKTIAEISRERIRRAGAKITKGDVGFKSLKLTQSNYRQWNVITEKEDEQKLKDQMKLFAEKPLVDGYDEKTVVYEILTKEGFDINAKVEEKTVEKMKVWIISDSEKKMFVSFAKKLAKEQVESLKLAESDTFVCFDSALDDTTKVNLVRNFNLKVI